MPDGSKIGMGIPSQKLLYPLSDDGRCPSHLGLPRLTDIPGSPFDCQTAISDVHVALKKRPPGDGPSKHRINDRGSRGNQYAAVLS
jgi:hypothetical protein